MKRLLTLSFDSAEPTYTIQKKPNSLEGFSGRGHIRGPTCSNLTVSWAGTGGWTVKQLKHLMCLLHITVVIYASVWQNCQVKFVHLCCFFLSNICTNWWLLCFSVVLFFFWQTGNFVVGIRFCIHLNIAHMDVIKFFFYPKWDIQPTRIRISTSSGAQVHLWHMESCEMTLAKG